MKLENDRCKQAADQSERRRQESLEEFKSVNEFILFRIIQIILLCQKLSETKQLYDSAQSDRSQMETHLAITRKHMQTHAERADRLLVEVRFNF